MNRSSNTGTTAHAVVTNPEHFHTRPAILACAWDILMAERGKRVDLDRLGPPAHIVKAEPFNRVLADFDSRTPRLIARIRHHVAHSTGGDAA
ncbi:MULTISPECIES: hypothetical protein [Sulfitobacter]|uniref:Uncharacterized protein n=1 Tax=Sulfitobacter profundi TaxID=2679961 RepID=A0ABW1YXQ9_9RHOB|nr:hypothetical protein [Sulfitobacter indolifex]